MHSVNTPHSSTSRISVFLEFLSDIVAISQFRLLETSVWFVLYGRCIVYIDPSSVISVYCSLYYRSCYLTPATPATPASNIKGTATDNFLVSKKWLAKACRISAKFTKMAHRIFKLHAKNFQFFSRRILSQLCYCSACSALVFSNTYPTPCLPLAGFESVNAGNDVGGFYDV